MAAKKFSLLFILLLDGAQNRIHYVSPFEDADGNRLEIEADFFDWSSPILGFRIGKRPKSKCLTSITSVWDKRKVCSGSVIFQDDFHKLDTDKWQVHQYIPSEDYGNPFVSYQLSSVSVKKGFLRIRPRLLEDLPPFNHESVHMDALDLKDGCTVAEFCYVEPTGAIILPPVVSGKITSKDFAFTYGIVKIRAKLPKGDWLYPELHLESLRKNNGRRNHASGIIKIATARGNLDTKTKYSNKVLYSKLIASSKCKDVFRFKKTLDSSDSNENWGDEFHDYKLVWRPDEIIFKVDGEEWASVDGPLRDRFDSCGLPIYAEDAPDMAPFDHHFFISLSVGAGGTTEFPDGIFSTGHRKPWRNAGVKAQYDFWRDIGHWSRTWHKAQLVIDYVKVIAL